MKWLITLCLALVAIGLGCALGGQHKATTAQPSTTHGAETSQSATHPLTTSPSQMVVDSALADAAALLLKRADALKESDPEGATFLRQVASELASQPASRQRAVPGVRMPRRPGSPIVVSEGVGYGDVVIGATAEEIIDALGPPDRRADSPHLWRL